MVTAFFQRFIRGHDCSDQPGDAGTDHHALASTILGDSVPPNHKIPKHGHGYASPADVVATAGSELHGVLNIFGPSKI
jgi:hypothetical protein